MKNLLAQKSRVSSTGPETSVQLRRKKKTKKGKGKRKILNLVRMVKKPEGWMGCQATTKQRQNTEDGPVVVVHECAFCDSHGKLTGGWVWALCALWGCLGVATRCLQKHSTAAVTMPAILSIRKTRAIANQVACMPRIVDASESGTERNMIR